MKLKSLCLPACGALVAACFFAPNRSQGQAGSDEAAIAALRLADVGYVLQNGTVVLSGDTASLLADPQLVERYLG